MRQTGSPTQHDDPRAASNQDPGIGTITFGDVLRVLVRGAPFVLIVMALAVVVTVALTRSQDAVYRASVAMVVTQSVPSYADLDVVVPPVVDAGVYRTAIYDGGVLRGALEIVEGRPLSARELEDASEAVRVTVESQDRSSVLRVFARDTSPERAARIVNAVADELVAWDQARARQRLQQSIAALGRSIAVIDAELSGSPSPEEPRASVLAALRERRTEELALAQSAVDEAVALALIEPLAAARPPERAVGPRLVLNTAVALVLSFVGGYGLLLISWTTNPRVGNRHDLEAFSHLPVLAEFARRDPRQKGLSEDGISWLRTRLGTSHDEGASRILVVAGLRSVTDEDGVAVGLAESFARGGDDTLLIDADLRTARSTVVLGMGTTRSTPYDDAVAADPAHAFAPVSVVVSRDRTFEFLPSAAAMSHPVDRLVRLFDEREDAWRTEHDVVIVSAAPLLEHADGLAVAGHADGVVLCARRGSTTRADVEQALALLAEQGVPVLGVVLTHAKATVSAGPLRKTGLSRRRARKAQAPAQTGAASVRTKPSRRG